MKTILSLILVFAALSHVEALGDENGPASGNEFRIESADWYNYSMGLYYSSAKDYSRAIEFFEKAASSQKELHLIYYRIAGCHFNLMNYDKANHYADLSIQKDDRFDKPYFSFL